jgi:acyl transferase domain-containing protein/NAD(P)H-dependent flavin oxidoreductase YrpB (nitropropane dioxygenase family)
MTLFVDTRPGWRGDALEGVRFRRWDERHPDGWVAGPGVASARAGEHARLAPDQVSEIPALRERGVHLWLACATPAQIAVAAAHGVGAWLRGVEVGGPIDVHPVTALLREAARLDVPWVAEGPGERGLAAALAVGAAGVAYTWLPDLNGSTGTMVRRATARDTIVLGELCDRRYRVLSQPIDLVRRLQRASCDGDASALDAAFADAVRDGFYTETEEPRLLPVGEAVASLGCPPTAMRDAIRARLVVARDTAAPRQDPLQTGLPVVQGPMANVAERPELGVAVARAGGMPFVALGALDAAQATRVVDDARAIPGRWGVGIIGFDLSPLRDVHVEVAARSEASVVLVAGGSPALAQQIQRFKPVWLHTPSAGLCRLAMEAGVAGVIFEGADAGGHVGALSSAALWEEGLAAVEAWIDEGRPPPLVVLAGGVGDAASAAFAFAMAAGVTRRGGQVVVQAGTAFMFTHDIVEARQITAACQRVALRCERTVLVGSTVRMPLRVAPNPWSAEARDAERVATGSVEARRLAIEQVNVGRTRIAAKGIERNPQVSSPDASRYADVPVPRQLAEGAFTMGSGAAVTRQLQTVREVVRSLSVDAGVWLASRRADPGVARVGGRPVVAAPTATVTAHLARASASSASSVPSSSAEPIAVVGLGCVMPRAFDVPSFWANLVRGVDAVGPVPPDRWDAALYHDPDALPNGAEFTRSAVAGAVVGFELDPLAFRIPPKVFASMDPTQRMALAAAAQAVRGLSIDGERAAVILGNAMGGEFAKGLSVRVRAREILGLVRDDPALADVDDAAWSALVSRVSARLDERLPAMNANSMAGVLSNVAAGRVAAWLDWHGGAFTVDAACASALASVAIAVDWLRNGRCDAVLAGGVDGDLSPETYVGFSLAGALSSRGSTPFSEGADGFVIGEGAGLLLLTRLSDAIAKKLPVYAVIRGVGESSDGRGRGVTAPHPDGQQRALARAFADAGLSPSDVGMVEAHGTGTAIGDATETAVLRQLYAACSPHSVWLGSVKSMVGHLKGAAGAAGAVKAVLSVLTGVVPPTLHAGPVDPSLGLQESAFRLPRSASRWSGRRVAAVSAFGFGGTNFHALLEAPPDGAVLPAEWPLLAREAERASEAPIVWELPETQAASAARVARPRRSGGVDVWLFGADDRDGLLRALSAASGASPADSSALVGARCRLAVLAPAGREASAIAEAQAVVSSGQASRLAFLGEGPAAPLGFAFSGQGSQRLGMFAALEAVATSSQLLNQLAAALPSDLPASFSALERDPATGAATLDTRAVHRVLFAASLAWDALLVSLGVAPVVRLGHSLGEFAALAAAGRVDPVDGLRAVIARGDALHAAPQGRMLSIEADFALAMSLCGPSVWLSARNGPTAFVLAAVGDAFDELVATTRRMGVRAVPLAVAHPFHTPVLADAAAALDVALRLVRFTTGAPVLSALDGASFHDDPREQLVAAVVRPVQFWEASRAPVTWVEIGPGTALARHLGGIPIDPDQTPLGTLTAAARLWAAGYPGLLQRSNEVGLPARSRWTERSAPVPVAPPASRRASPADTPPKAPPATPSTADPVYTAVLDAIVEVTGYPRSFLVAGGDLEADLGVDSIRKLEILGAIEVRLGVRADAADTARLASLDVAGLVAWARSKLADQRQNPPASAGGGCAAVARVVVRRRVAARHTVVEAPETGVRLADGRCWVRWPTPAGRSVPDAVREVLIELQHCVSQVAPAPLVAWLGDGPVQAAIGGFVRSVARDWGVPVTVVRGDAPPSAWAAFLGDAGGVGATYTADADGLWCDTWVDCDAEPAALAETPVVLAIGSVDGVLGPCLDALPGAVGVVVSRRAPARLPSGFLHVPGDATDPEVVARAAVLARSLGPLDTVIHAAGALADARVDAVTPDQVERVLAAKLDIADRLFAATAGDHPRRYVVFTSIAGVDGNRGQSIYAAANAALDAWPHPTAETSTPIAWGPWSDRGMAATSQVQRALSLAGVRSLAPAVGAAAFRRVIGLGRCAVVADDAPSTWVVRARAPGRCAVTVRIRPDNALFIDHAPRGRPLVPFAWWADVGVTVADWAGPPSDLADLCVHAPGFVGDGFDATVVVADRRLTIHVADRLLVSASLARRSSDTPAPPSQVRQHDDLGARRAYRPDLLFHGPAWQVIASVAEDTASATLSAATDLARVGDAVWQLVALRAAKRGDPLALPRSVGRWSARGVSGPLAGPVQIALIPSGDRLDAAAWDADGACVLVATDLRAGGERG